VFALEVEWEESLARSSRGRLWLTKLAIHQGFVFVMLFLGLMALWGENMKLTAVTQLKK